jgi:hypothetical protein
MVAVSLRLNSLLVLGNLTFLREVTREDPKSRRPAARGKSCSSSAEPSSAQPTPLGRRSAAPPQD